MELFELLPNMKARRQIGAKKVLGTTTVLLAFLSVEFRQCLWTLSYYSLWKTSLSSDSTSKESQSYIKGAQHLVLVPMYLNRLDSILLFLYVPKAPFSQCE